MAIDPVREGCARQHLKDAIYHLHRARNFLDSADVREVCKVSHAEVVRTVAVIDNLLSGLDQ